MRWGIGAIALVACYRPQPQNCTYRCPDGLCPAGLSCQSDGYCSSDDSPLCSTMIDASTSVRCDNATRFDVPTPVSFADTQDQLQGRLVRDERAIYFHCSRTGLGELCFAQRDSVGVPFGGAVALQPNIDTALLEDSPTVSGDEKLLVFARYASGIDPTSLDLFLASRASTTSPFDPPVPLVSLNAVGRQDYAPYMLSDGSALYYSALTGGTDLQRATNAAGTFALPEPVPGVSGDHVVVTLDELSLYSYQSGEILQAGRSKKDESWGPPTILTDLGPGTPTWISDDNCVLYFSATETGVFRLKRAQRPL